MSQQRLAAIPAPFSRSSPPLLLTSLPLTNIFENIDFQKPGTDMYNNSQKWEQSLNTVCPNYTTEDREQIEVNWTAMGRVRADGDGPINRALSALDDKSNFRTQAETSNPPPPLLLMAPWL